MTETETDTCLPAVTWFLADEGGKPLGQMRRREIPAAGTRVEGGARFGEAVVVSVQELRPSCAMRRFKVAVRVTAAAAR